MELSTETKLRAILDGTDAGIWEWGLESGEFKINCQWAEMLGYERDELTPLDVNTWHALCHPRDLEIAYHKLHLYLEGSADRYDCIIRMRHKQGEWRFIHARGKVVAVESASGNRWLMGTHLDVTEEQRSQQQLRLIAESVPGIVYSFTMNADGSYHFPFISPKTTVYYGLDPVEVQRDPTTMFKAVHPDDLPKVHHTIQKSYKSLSEWNCEYRVIIDGLEYWMRGVSKPEEIDDQSVTWHGIIVNIDSQKTLEARLRQLSITDELTGLYNRRHFLKRLEEVLDNYQRNGSVFSLVSIDLDYFKEVNDTFGHLTGDRALREFAALLSSNSRSYDVLARTGGEEFAILLPGADTDSAISAVEKIRQRLESHEFHNDSGDPFNITLSAGVLGCGPHCDTVDQIMSLCDERLYRAKRCGRDTVIHL